MANVTIIAPTIDTEQNRKLRCAAYCRVSSSSEDQLHSYSAQVKFYGGMFNNSETEELVDIYADEGITGTSAEKRSEFKRLISDCRKGKIDRIYTKSISRFARNTKDCLKSIRELKALGITIFFEKENIDTANVTDEMIITIMGGLAQEESTSISQNMRWSVKKRMQKGEYHQGIPPYGYIIENGKLIINREEADIVKMIFGWYLNGIGITTIVMKLNEMSIPPSMNGTMWGSRSINYILSNERYTGNMLLQKTYASDTMPVQQIRNKGERDQYYVTNTHEAIISQETFDRAQEIKAERASIFYSGRKPKTALSQIMRCEMCGSIYKRKVSHGKIYYVCNKHDFSADLCLSRRLEETVIKQAFIALCNKLTLHYREILLPLERQLRELNARKSSGNTKVLDIRKDIAALKEQKHVIARLRTKGFIDEQKYNEQLTILESKLSRLERELNKLSRADSEDETLEQLDMLIDIFESRKGMTTEFDDELFGAIVERIIVKQNTLEFHLISGLKFSEKI